MGKTIIHVTESLDRGGAEILFINYINALPSNFTNIVVYLREPAVILEKLTNVAQVYCLQYTGKKNFVQAAFKLNKLVKHHKAVVIHSHLYWPTLISRIAKPKNAYLISSVHNLISKDAFEPNILSKVAEKLSAHITDCTLFVSKAVKSDYESYIKLYKPSAVLYNFIDVKFLHRKLLTNSSIGNKFKLISVGNLRYQKNFPFLIKCLAKLKDSDVQLHIYGYGPEQKLLEKMIKDHCLHNVHLMGSCKNVDEVLEEYDAFVLASRYEGFCLAMVEAMAVGLPCIVPDIDILKEVSESRQLYFSQENEDEFIDCVSRLRQSHEFRIELMKAGKSVASKYTKENHIKQLAQIYEEAFQQSAKR